MALRLKIASIIVGLLALGGAFFVGMKYGESIILPTSRGSIVREQLKGYTSPSLLCDIAGNDEVFTELKPLKNALTDVIKAQLKNKTADRISIYFRALNSGRWVGINENDTFVPASLFKVPMLISYMKEAESNPSLLKSRLIYDSSFDSLVRKFGSEPTLKDGASYSINDLLEKMIIESDNTPLFLLAKYLNQDIYNQLFKSLQIPVPSDPHNVQDVDFLSPKDFSKFFRILFSSSYLSQAMSERALSILVRADFPQGLKAGIPEGVAMANKFGVRTTSNENTKQPISQLHDCGIIYYKDHPYFLCVMTEGDNIVNLEMIIRTISKLTYEQVDLLFHPKK